MEAQLRRYDGASGRLQYKHVLQSRENKEQIERLSKRYAKVQEWRSSVMEATGGDQVMTYAEVKAILDELQENMTEE